MKKMILLLFLSGSILLGNRFIPDYMSFQYAGNLGLVASGAGYQFFDKHLQVELLYGYLPKSIGGVAVHSFSAKTTYSPWWIKLSKRNHLAPLTMGLAAIYNPGDRYFLESPGRYPSEYYRQTALHFAPFLGMKLLRRNKLWKRVEQTEFYVELGTIDYYLRDYLRSIFEEGYLDLEDIVNLAVGLRFHF